MQTFGSFQVVAHSMQEYRAARRALDAIKANIVGIKIRGRWEDKDDSCDLNHGVEVERVHSRGVVVKLDGKTYSLRPGSFDLSDAWERKRANESAPEIIFTVRDE